MRGDAGRGGRERDPPHTRSLTCRGWARYRAIAAARPRELLPPPGARGRRRRSERAATNRRRCHIVTAGAARGGAGGRLGNRHPLAVRPVNPDPGSQWAAAAANSGAFGVGMLCDNGPRGWRAGRGGAAPGRRRGRAGARLLSQTVLSRVPRPLPHGLRPHRPARGRRFLAAPGVGSRERKRPDRLRSQFVFKGVRSLERKVPQRLRSHFDFEGVQSHEKKVLTASEVSLSSRGSGAMRGRC